MSALTTSALRNTTSTPTRATTSNLSLRAAPLVPPASQAYEPLVKNVLRHRLIYKLLPYSAALTWIVVSFLSLWMQGSVRELGLSGTLVNPVRPSVLVFTVLSWVAAVPPIVIFRKRYVTATPTPATSPSQIFRTASKKLSISQALLTYTVPALFLTLLYVISAYVFENDPRLTLFVKSRKHPYYLNGRLLYLVSSQLLVAVVYLLRNILLDRFAVRWPLSASRNSGIPNFRFGYVIAVAVTLLLLATFTTAVHLLLFGLTRSVALPLLYKLPFVRKLLRPFTAHFLRGPYSFVLLLRSVPLIFRVFCLGFSTLAIWESVESIFDEVVAESPAIAQTTADPALCIVSGTTSQNLYFKYSAYEELVKFARDESPAGSARRKALFSDQKYNPSVWGALSRQTLVTLGKDYQLLLRRGKPAAPPPAAAPPPKVPPPPPSVRQTRLLRTSVLKQTPQSPLRSAIDTLASDAGLPATTTEAVPELFRSVMHTEPPKIDIIKKSETEVSKAVTTVSQGTKKWKEKIVQTVEDKVVPGWVIEVKAKVNRWWTRERVNKVIEGVLPNRKLDAWAIEGLSCLVCSSLTEDTYGVVQRDIPRILEAMVSFLTALEDYQVELHAKYPAFTAQELANLPAAEAEEKEQIIIELARAKDVIGEVSDALKDGLVRIVHTFGERLSAFRFPPRIASKLQDYVDYS